MHITWHGDYTIKIVSAEAVLVIDPNNNFRAKADIVSLSSPNVTSMAYMSGLVGDPIVLAHPGEYSVSGMTGHAIAWYDESGEEHTVQRWDIENMVLLHLGMLNRGLSDEELAELERTAIDILFLPVDDRTLPLKVAMDILTKIEPRVVIPVNFTNIKAFAQEMGVAATGGEPKFLAKAGKLPVEEVQIVILKP